mmetsp:Transcript_18995/g.55127  ORF Transcript_18995/g.55127 Transcript_18995/m.55127 type:complete len:222 (+) Transcript_18995:1706-2371(+)
MPEGGNRQLGRSTTGRAGGDGAGRFRGQSVPPSGPRMPRGADRSTRGGRGSVRRGDAIPSVPRGVVGGVGPAADAQVSDGRCSGTGMLPRSRTGAPPGGIEAFGACVHGVGFHGVQEGRGRAEGKGIVRDGVGGRSSMFGGVAAAGGHGRGGEGELGQGPGVLRVGPQERQEEFEGSTGVRNHGEPEAGRGQQRGDRTVRESSQGQTARRWGPSGLRALRG